MTKKKISNNPKLNVVNFTITEPKPVYSRATEREIPGLESRKFVLICPYRIGESLIYPARPYEGDHCVRLGFNKVQEVRVRNYTLDYLLQGGFLNDRTSVEMTKVRTGIFQEPQPALDNGDPLNAYQVRGYLYRLIPHLR